MTNLQDDRGVVEVASAAHAAINAKHDEARARLLESLPEVERSRENGTRLAAWRVVVRGLGLGAIASSVLLVVWLLGPASPAAALEKVAQALERVNTYSYQMEQVYVSRQGEGRTVRQVTVGRWRTNPVALHATLHIVETLGTNTTSPGKPKTLVDIEEAHQAGQSGILVDHLKKEYWWMNGGIDANKIPPGSPQVAVYMVQQRRGRVLSDLGRKRIDGKLARGLEILLDDGQPVSELGVTTPDEEPTRDWRNANIEVWIDPETDLPIEFRYARRGDDFKTTYRFTNLKWNVDFDAGDFEVAIPPNYAELDKSDDA